MNESARGSMQTVECKMWCQLIYSHLSALRSALITPH
jgi:hypothetical protein